VIPLHAKKKYCSADCHNCLARYDNNWTKSKHNLNFLMNINNTRKTSSTYYRILSFYFYLGTNTHIICYSYYNFTIILGCTYILHEQYYGLFYFSNSYWRSRDKVSVKFEEIKLNQSDLYDNGVQNCENISFDFPTLFLWIIYLNRILWNFSLFSTALTYRVRKKFHSKIKNIK